MRAMEVNHVVGKGKCAARSAVKATAGPVALSSAALDLAGRQARFGG